MARTTVALGRTELVTAPLLLGTWAWGDRRVWRYGVDVGPDDVVDAFVASVEAGVTMLDTAEVYGDGESEKIVGFFARKHEGPLLVASKFALLPGRPGARALRPALAATLRRLGRAQVDLYQVHWPDVAMASIEELMDAMASAVRDGLVRAVGVSNFGADEMRRAHAALARHGVPLATNQVRYNLLHRAPERDGVLEACRELGVSLLAYSPLEQGMLSGKYRPGAPVPEGARASMPWFSEQGLRAALPVVDAVTRIAGARGATPSQVALAWLMAKPGVVPIAGAKSGRQAAENAAALGLELTTDELSALGAADVAAG